MQPMDDPLVLTEAQRFREIAGILAAALVRLHLRNALAIIEEKSADRSEDSLAVGAPLRLSVNVA